MFKTIFNVPRKKVAVKDQFSVAYFTEFEYAEILITFSTVNLIRIFLSVSVPCLSVYLFSFSLKTLVITVFHKFILLPDWF